MQLGMNTCELCPRCCNVDRTHTPGFCGGRDALEVAAVCVHRGEEPPLVPIVNVFFAHCNLHCIYCQNGDISGADTAEGFVHYRTIEEVTDRICQLLPESGGMLGFVTATHYADRLPAIIDAVHQRGYTPTVVYNSGGYEREETLRSLEGLVDVYLPDMKYMDSTLAATYSHAADYPEVAAAALLEMKRQVGTGLKCDDKGVAYRGLIVRHLVLPGHTKNSVDCLEWLADNFIAPMLHVSLMAQYYPARPDLPAPLNRPLTAEEYSVVAERYQQLGFDGWLQELEAESHYRPDFTLNDNPFEKR